MDIIEFAGKTYPALQSKGFAAQYAFPFAMQVLDPAKHTGVDIGYHKPYWKLPGAVGIDVNKVCSRDEVETMVPGTNAFNVFTPGQDSPGWDYIFSSHCLEHLPDWIGALNHWTDKLKPGGTLFLYLPDCEMQEYWRPYNNRKHLNWITPAHLKAYLTNAGYCNIFVTSFDLNYSFYAIADKPL